MGERIMKNKGTKISVGEFLQSNTALLAVIAVLIFGTVMYGGTFLNYKRNIINVLHYASLLGIMGVGVNLCFIIGARDLSVGAVAAAASMVTALLSPYGLIPSVLGSLCVGLCFGLLNGIVIAKFKVQPFIATLGTQLAARGVALLINHEYSITIDASATVLKAVGNGNFLGIIPNPTLIFLLLIIAFTVMTRHTTFGRSIYAVGGNEESAEMMGIRVDRVKILTFVISGLMAAISGIVLCGHINAGQPTACEGWEMTIMAAVVIGGTPVRGGTGRISGILFGAIFVQFISNLINLNGHVSAYWKDILTGVILLIAVLLQVSADRRKERIKSARKTTEAVSQ